VSPRFTTAGVVRAALLLAVLTMFLFGVPQHWILNMAIFTVMYGAMASAWNILGGYTGYVSLAHAGFFGIGAYAAGHLLAHTGVGGGYATFLWFIPLGIAVALVSLPIGWVVLRRRAVVFAIVTITLLFMIQTLAYNLSSLTDGAQGWQFPTPPFSNAHFERPFLLAMSVLLAAALGTSWWLRGSRLGAQMIAIREDEDKARGLGINTTAVKLAAFALSVGFTAVAGAIWGYYITFVYPQFAIDPLVTVGTVLMVFLGGRGTLWGPVLGALLVVPAQQYMAYELGGSQLYLVGYAAVFLVTMLLLPQGILPSLAGQLRRRRAREASSPDRRPVRLEPVEPEAEPLKAQAI
jgi:branched-chain amino acid transport system permease protein